MNLNHKFVDFEKRDQNLDLHHFTWPKSVNGKKLKSNSQRLVHHSELKMLPNLAMKIFRFRMEQYISSNRELDLMWEAFKHIGYVHSYYTSPEFNGKMSPKKYMKKLRDYLGDRGSLVEKLEAILT